MGEIKNVIASSPEQLSNCNKILSAKSPSGRFLKLYQSFVEDYRSFYGTNKNMFSGFLPLPYAMENTVYRFVHSIEKIDQKAAKAIQEFFGIRKYRPIDSPFHVYKAIDVGIESEIDVDVYFLFYDEKEEPKALIFDVSNMPNNYLVVKLTDDECLVSIFFDDFLNKLEIP